LTIFLLTLAAVSLIGMFPVFYIGKTLPQFLIENFDEPEEEKENESGKSGTVN
jgi:hypothetical protein